MLGHDVVALGVGGTVPGGVEAFDLQARLGAPSEVVLDRRSAGDELEPDEQSAARRDVCSGTMHGGAPVRRGDEPDDVAGEHDEVEGLPEVERGEVGLDPLQVGGLASGAFEHVGVEVGTDGVVAASGELDRHTPGTAAGVEHPTTAAGEEFLDTVGLAVGVRAVAGELLPAPVVGVEVGACPPGGPVVVHRGGRY